MIFTVAVPFVFAAFIENTIVASLASAAAVQTYIMMNEVANDVEDPFHYDPNQLPLPQMQYRLNERLLAVSKTERPLAFTDVGALDGPSNVPQLPPVRLLPLSLKCLYCLHRVERYYHVAPGTKQYRHQEYHKRSRRTSRNSLC